MKLKFLASLLMLVSFNSFAGTEFLGLTCKLEEAVSHPPSLAFKLEVKFDKKANAVNNSGLAQNLKAGAVITFMKDGQIRTAVVDNLNLGQETSAYGYEIHSSRKILGSQYDTNLSLHPEIKKSIFSGTNLIQYKGSLELNVAVDNEDLMLAITDTLICTPQN